MQLLSGHVKPPSTSVCIGLNIQGYNPSPSSKSGWKLPRMREYVTELQENHFFVPFVALVETWLCPEVDNAQIAITDFNIFRQDRIRKKHGGALLYINKNGILEKGVFFKDSIAKKGYFQKSVMAIFF